MDIMANWTRPGGGSNITWDQKQQLSLIFKEGGLQKQVYNVFLIADCIVHVALEYL